MANGPNGRGFDPGTRAILRELRDIRVDMREDRARSDDRFERMMREVRQDSARRDADMLQGLRGITRELRRDLRTVGLAIVGSLNRNTKILERQSQILEEHGRILGRIDRSLGARRNGRPDQGNGRGA